MISQSNVKVAIIRTERGLTISGTRITLYDVMDYVKSQYPSKFFQGFGISDIIPCFCSVVKFSLLNE